VTVRVRELFLGAAGILAWTVSSSPND